MKTLNLKNINISNDLPFVLFAGINVLESENLALEVAGKLKEICSKLEIPYIFKASFDKANRSSIDSFRGLAFDKSMEIFLKIKSELDLPIITDIHEPYQAEIVAPYVDILQLPAFLSRQTDLVVALAKTGKIINVKKAQFLAPDEMKHIIHKLEQAGNEQIILCERGTCFGYKNLVVDMLGFSIMKKFNYPVIFDATHSLQEPGKLANAAGGRREFVLQLAKGAISQKIAGIFLETHPNPEVAKCDGPSAIHLKYVGDFLYQLKELDSIVKKQLDIYGE